MGNFQEKISFIWDLADLLRGVYKRNEYQKVILPFTVLKRFDSVLSDSKEAILETYNKYKGQFENMVGLELYRAILNWNDLGLGDFSLHYIRNKEKEEVDFLICKDHHPMLLIECKLSDENVSSSLIKFQNKLDVPAIQLVNKQHVGRIITNQKNKILIISAPRWLSFLS